MTFRLASIALVALFAPAYVYAQNLRDIDQQHKHYEAIRELHLRRIVSGYPDGNFHPEVRINRVEFVKIVTEALYDKEEIESCLADVTPSTALSQSNEAMREMQKLINFEQLKFTDVDYEEWYGGHLCIAQLENIVGGYDDGTFRPLQRVNFAEAATILARAFGVLKESRHLKPAAIWYKPFIEDLSDVRAIPTSIGGFDYYITRAEMAEMVHRLLEFTEQRKLTSKPFLRYEEITRSGNWKEYVNEEFGFSMLYSQEWPEPYLIRRGFFDGGIPSKTSKWRLYLGPELSCTGYGECVERKFMLDGFAPGDADATLKELESKEFVTIIEDKVVNDNRMIMFEDVGICVQRSALIFGKRYLFRISALCGGDVPTQARLLQRLVERFKTLDDR